MCLALPAKLLETEDIGDNRVGVVELEGARRQVFLNFIPEAQPGEYVLVHAGFAVSRLSQREAQETRDLLEQIGAASLPPIDDPQRITVQPASPH